ncbi:MAG: hypothetical protein AB1744_01525, partial [Candidatus Zixiibacteriota bacterium]
YSLLLVTPDIAVSSAESYSALKSTLTKSTVGCKMNIWLTVSDLVESLRLSRNDFEPVHFQSYPILAWIKEELVRQGAILARMTGSGPTVFGMFEQAPQKQVGKVFAREDWQVQQARPISLAGRQLQ